MTTGTSMQMESVQMKHIHFEIIEDSRLSRPKIEDQLQSLRNALAPLGVEFSISPPRYIDWSKVTPEEPSYQYRSSCNIHYQPYRGRRLQIITAINSAIPAPHYDFS